MAVFYLHDNNLGVIISIFEDTFLGLFDIKYLPFTSKERNGGIEQYYT